MVNIISCMRKKKGPKKGTKYKNTNPFAFGKTLAAQRRRKGLTQEELGELTGLSKRVVSHYEREVENPSIDVVKKFAAALTVPIQTFIEPPDEMPHSPPKNVVGGLKKRFKLVENLSPKSQKALKDYIDILVKADE